MDELSANTRRIAKNTLLLYVRMLFGMLVALYTSRVVLNTLGVEDYGIYNVVGGFVAMFSLISSSLSSAVSRFLTFELGKGNMERLKYVFSTSLLIHIALAGIIFILAETAGVWFLNTQMTIPTARLHAANWVFQASVLSFMSGLFSVPYNASIVSHERMSAFAYIGILDVLLRLFIVLFITYISWNFDRLIVYSLLLAAVSIVLQCIYILYCRKNFAECRLRICFDRSCWVEMSSFAGWNFIGGTASLLKTQGVNVLLNLFVGPVLNAARGIAGSVNTVVCSFANNFMTALRPQITKSYASGNYSYMMSLVERGARFSFYTIFILTLPVLFETDFILTLWLKQYPEHTVNFIRLVLLASLCDVLSNTLITLQAATGKIRNYQLAVGGMLIMNFPLSYLCLKFGFPPESTLVVALFVSVCCLVLRLSFLRFVVGFSIKRYLKNVCANVLLVSLTATIIPVSVYFQMQEGWERFIIVSLTCILSVGITVYLIGCTVSERQFILSRITAIKIKIVG